VNEFNYGDVEEFSSPETVIGFRPEKVKPIHSLALRACKEKS